MSGVEARTPFVIAGIALDGIKSEIAYVLTKLETQTGKGEKDWHSTKDAAIRIRYIEGLLAASQLVGRVFFGGEPAITSEHYWSTRVNVLAEAIRHYSHGGRCHHEIAHEGLTGRPRHQLLKDLRSRGVKRVTVEPANIVRDPETRCADALAGYIRTKLFEDSEWGRGLPDLPSWLVECSGNKTKALRQTTGGLNS